MTNALIAVLILFSSAASIYYSVNGAAHPESALIYNRAGMSRIGIRILSVLLGVGGTLILLPQTFTLGGALLIAHSMTTIGCFVVTRDLKGGAWEFVFLQVPILMIRVGYPSSVLEKARSLLF